MPIDISVNTSGSTGPLNALEEAFVGAEKALVDLTRSSRTYDDAGKQVVENLRAQLSATKEVTQTTYTLEDGTNKLVTSVRTSTDAMRLLNIEQQKLKSAANSAKLTTLLDTKGLDSNAIAKVEKIRTAILSLNTLEVTPLKLDEFFADIKAGKIPEAIGDLAKLRNAIFDYHKIAEPKARKSAPKNMVNRELAEDLLLPPGTVSNFTPENFANLDKYLDRLAKLPVTAKQVEEVFYSIRSGASLRLDDTNLIKLRELLKQIIELQGAAGKPISPEVKDIRKQGTQDFLSKPNADALRANVISVAFGEKEQREYAKAEAAIRKLNTAAITPDTVKTMIDRIRAGDIPKVTGDLQILSTQLQKIVDLERNSIGRSLDAKPNPGQSDKGPKNGGFPSPDENALSRLTDYQNGITRIITSLQYLVAFKVFGALGNAFSQAVSDAKQYQIQVSLIRTISQEAQQSTGEWARQVSNLSSFLGSDFKDTSDAVYDAVSNQVAKGEGALKFVATAGEFARSTNSTLKDSTNLLSSITNTYGASAGSTEQIAAKLFATIDRGRIVTEEIANTFGRVAFSAQDVGLKFGEVTGALALLTRSGVTSDDAVTLINNLVQQVSKPSVEMKKFLEEIGIGASRDAFKIKGLVGVIELLQDAVQKGKLNVQEIFPEIRAQRAFSFLRSNTDKLQEDIEYTSKTDTGVYDRAIEIRAESSADRLAKISRSFQNTLANSVGTSFNEVLLRSFEKLSGLNTASVTKDMESFAKATAKVEENLNRIARIAVTAAAGYMVLKLGLTSLTVVQELAIQLTLRSQLLDATRQSFQVRGIALNRAEAISIAGLNTAKRASLGSALFGGPVGIGVGLLAAAATYAVYSNAVVEGNNEASQSVSDLVANMKKLIEAQELAKQVDVGKEQREVFNDISKILANDIGQAMAANNASLDRTQQLSKSVGSELGLKFAGGLNIARGALQKLEQEYAQFDTRIKNSVKSLEGLREKFDDIAFATQKRYANPQQSIQLDTNRIQVLMTQIDALYAKNTDESVAAARTLMSKVAELQASVFDAVTDARVKAAPAGSVVTVDIGPLLAAQKELSDYALNRESAYQAKLNQTQDMLKTQKGLETTKIAELEKAVKEFDSFSIKTADGQGVKQEYKTQGRLDNNKVQADLDRVIKNITEKFPADIINSLDFARDITKRRDLATKEVNETRIAEELKTKQSSVINGPQQLEALTKSFGKAVEENDVAMKSSAKSITSSLKAIADTLATAPQDFRKKSFEFKGDYATDAGARMYRAADGTPDYIRNISANFLRGMGVILNGGTTVTNPSLKPLFDSADRTQAPGLPSEKTRLELLQRYQDLKAKTDAAIIPSKDVAGTKIVDPEKLQEVISLFKRFKFDTEEYFVQLAKETDLSNGEGKRPERGSTKLVSPIPGVDGNTTGELDLVIKQLEMAQSKLVENAAKIAETESKRQELMSSTKTLQDASNTATKGLVPLGAAAGGAALGVLNLGTTSGDAAGKVKELGDSLQKLLELKAPQTPDELNKNLEKNKIKGMAYGGPIGSDDTIYKRNDEFVSNGSATTQNYSRLMSMNNQARIPSSFTDNYSITVNESQTPQMTADAIYGVINRGRRTGKI